MKVVNEELLAVFRTKRRCEFCHAPSLGRLAPHHVHTRGAGRVDIAENLIALCPMFCGGNCHAKVHDGKLSRPQMLEAVAKREKMAPEAITMKVYEIRRAEHCPGYGAKTRIGPGCEECGGKGYIVRKP